MYDAVILVVDDEQSYLDSITVTLREKKFRILQALDGKMGIAVTKRFMPDIIIADWEMPEMNGLKMIEELKSDETTRDIPIIMCTGIMTTSENLDTALEAGAVDYIRKPIDAIELTARINAALNLSMAFKRIKAQNDELLHLNNTKNKFFSIIAHDLRGPFGSIMCLSSLLCETIDDFDRPAVKEQLKLICESTRNAFNLLDNLLNWSKSQIDKLEFQFETISLDETVKDVVETLINQANNKNISLTYDVSTSAEIVTDKNILKTILRNLISNALKFTQNGGNVKIHVTGKKSEVEFAVIDNGIGMDDVFVNRLFKIGEKVNTSGTNNELGTGLGLILCREFAEKIGGTILVESEKGAGSTFRLSLPLEAPHHSGTGF